MEERVLVLLGSLSGVSTWELSGADVFECNAKATTAIDGIFQQSSQVPHFIWQT